MAKKVKATSIVLLIIFLMIRCVDVDRLDEQFTNIDIEGNLSPSFVLPLVNSSLTFQDLTERQGENTAIFIDYESGDTTRYYMGFRDTIPLDSHGLLYNIPDTTFSFSFGLEDSDIPAVPIPSGHTLGPIPISITESFEPIEDSRIKRIELSRGNLSGVIRNTFQNTIHSIITITSIKKKTDNTPLTIQINLSAGATNTSSLQFDLSNYYFDLYDENTNAYNTLSVETELTITSTGQPISASNSIEMDLSISNLDFSVAVGRIYKSIYVGKRDLSLGIFQNTIDANLHLEQPKVTFEFSNSYGVPVSFTFPHIYAKRGGTLDSLVNEGTLNENTLRIGSPNVVNYPTSYQPTLDPQKTILEISYANSNIVDIIDMAPSDLEVDTYFKLGSLDDGNDDYFISRNSKVSLISDIQIPLHGYANLVLNRDTIEALDLPELSFLDEYNIDSAQIDIRFVIRNGMPLDFDLQAYFIDSTGVVLDSLFNLESDSDFIMSATIDENGNATSSVETEHVVRINDTRYNRIRRADYIVLEVSLFTGGREPLPGENRPSVVIHSTNSIQFEMSAVVKACVGQSPDL